METILRVALFPSIITVRPALPLYLSRAQAPAHSRARARARSVTMLRDGKSGTVKGHRQWKGGEREWQKESARERERERESRRLEERRRRRFIQSNKR
jgi:hypothetical protein